MLKLNNKGFTLVELLAVIVILAVLIGIAVPTYINVSNNVKQNQYTSKIETIKIDAVKYAQDNNLADPETITIQTLIDAGYLAADNNKGEVINPVDNSVMNNYLIDLSIEDNEIKANISENAEKVDVTTYSSDITITADNLAINDNVTDWSNGDVTLTAILDSSKYNATACSYTFGGTTQDANYNNSTCKVTITSSLYLNAKVIISFTTEKGLISKEVVVRIDKEEPTINGIVEQTWETGATEKNITITASDGTGSGIKNIYIGSTKDINQATIIADEDNDNIVTIKKKVGTYYLFAMDNVGNYVSNTISVNNIDNQGPRVSFTQSKIDGDNGWYITNADIIVTIMDQVQIGDDIVDGGVGIDESSLTFKINNNIVSPTKLTDNTYKISISDNGIFNIEVNVKDVMGNANNNETLTIKKDNISPVVKAKQATVYFTGTIDQNSMIQYFNFNAGPSGIDESSIVCTPSSVSARTRALVLCKAKSNAGIQGENGATSTGINFINYYGASANYDTCTGSRTETYSCEVRHDTWCQSGNYNSDVTFGSHGCGGYYWYTMETCTRTTTYSYSCFSHWSCPSGGSLSGSNCYF